MKPRQSMPGVHNVLEQSVRARHARPAEHAKAAAEPDVHWPMILVSREFGSHGVEAGCRAAEFAVPLIVEAIAEQPGARQSLLEFLDECARTG